MMHQRIAGRTRRAAADTNPALARTIIQALAAGEVLGVTALLQRAAPSADLPTRLELARALRAQISSGTVTSRSCDRSVRLALTSRGRQMARALQPAQAHSHALLYLAAVALVTAGCKAADVKLPRGPAMALPTPVGVQQVRDAAGQVVYEPCNPCAAPSVKTPILGGYQLPENAHVRPVASAPVPGGSRLPGEARSSGIAAGERPALPVAQPAGMVPVPAVSSIPAAVAHFAFSSARLAPEARSVIQAFAARARTAAVIYVHGSTDSQGSKAANEALARKRAYAVRGELIAHGVPRDRIQVSYCANCFRFTNDTEAGRQANRRVDIGIDKPIL